MEVVHLVLGKANPGRMNGVNKVVDQLATRQVAAGMQAQVWGITKNPVHDYPARSYQTKLYQKHSNPFALCHELKAAMRSRKTTTVFHLHGGYVPAMFAAAKVLKSLQIRFVFTPHGSYNIIARERSLLRKKIYFKFFEKHLLNKATKVHSLGQSEVEGLQQIFPNNKSMLIPYGFEMNNAPLTSNDGKDFIVGFCGRLDVYTKGLNELLEGFEKFHRLQPASKLWIIGDGKELSQLKEKAIALSIDNAVMFWGSKYNEEKLKLLQQCHVFAAPSRNEGLPTAVLEAAALGIPCLVTKATNTGDAISKFNAGLVINDTDANEIKAGLQVLHEQLVAEKKPLGQNAKQMIAEEYNWDKILQAFHQLYTA